MHEYNAKKTRKVGCGMLEKNAKFAANVIGIECFLQFAWTHINLVIANRG
jgi:hypothetical protein